MMTSMLKLLAVAFLGFFGDPSYLWRVGVCLLAGAVAVVVAYLLWPGVLPLWPGAVTMFAVAAIGVLWEWRSSVLEQGRLK